MKAEQATTAQGGNPPAVERTITVTVNNRPVVFEQHKATGLEIKQAAIAQHVPIQADFALFEVKGQAPLKQVGDDEVVTLHPHQQFRAIGPDDNS